MHLELRFVIHLSWIYIEISRGKQVRTFDIAIYDVMKKSVTGYFI